MAGAQKAAGGRKNRKWGRNKVRCASYRAEHRRERNKAVRLIKHVASQPNELVGAEALKRCYNIIPEANVMSFIRKRDQAGRIAA